MSFQVQQSPSSVVLTETTGNCRAEILLFGALLNSFSANVHGRMLNVIDGYAGPTNAEENITPFFKSAKLSPFVCRVNNAQYKFANEEYTLTKYSSHGHAIHGLIFDAVYNLVEVSSNNDYAKASLVYDYVSQSEGFPFAYKCIVTYTLLKGNTLEIKTTVTNIGHHLLPIADGWHPYFTLGDTVDEYQVEFQSKEILEFDEALIPTGRLEPYDTFNAIRHFGPSKFDNCFTLNFSACQPLVVVRNPHKKVQLEIRPHHSYPYLQIFTPDHRRSIAIENLSAAPDALNNHLGLKVLEPNQQEHFITTFAIKPL